jgi:hypothetical protein
MDEDEEAYTFNYKDAIGRFRSAARALAKATGHMEPAFFSKGRGHHSYYGAAAVAEIYHFSGVPCWIPGDDNKSHIVACITEDGVSFHPMGKCPKRLAQVAKERR